MTKRTVVLSSATRMLLTMFSSVIDAQKPELGLLTNVDPVTLISGTRSTKIESEIPVYEVFSDVSGSAEKLATLPGFVSSSRESGSVN